MSYAIPARLAVVAQPGGALERFWKDYQASPYRVEGLESAILENFPAFDEDSLVLILTDVEAIQRRAVRLKLRRRAPVIVMRWWDALPTLARTLRNRLVFNRYTGVNFLPSRAAAPRGWTIPWCWSRASCSGRTPPGRSCATRCSR